MKVEAIRGGMIASFACMAFFTLFYTLEMDLLSTKIMKSSTKNHNQGMELLKLTMSQPDPQSSPRVKSVLTSPISCDRSHYSYDICSINGTTVLDPTVSTFYDMGPTNFRTPFVEKLRPYPRKSDSYIIPRINEVTLTSGPQSPPCMVQHSAPALVFSAKGYTGNFFHDFNDGFIPLFITVHSVFPNQDFITVVSESHDWWVHKYADLLGSFGNHSIIRLDNATATHCFPSATVGLISHGPMTINPKLIPNSKTILHFLELLEKTYGKNPPSISAHLRIDRPRLVLASRSGGIGRVILNQAEVKKVAEDEGFEVIVFEPHLRQPLRKAYNLLHSSHVMVGVHGATLTHSLFLRPGSVFMQVVPIGCEPSAESCFGKMAKDIGLEYIEYKIGLKESTLMETHGKDGVVALEKKNVGWDLEIMDIFLRKQNVKLDLNRFRKYLKKAYEKAKILMQKEN